MHNLRGRRSSPGCASTLTNVRLEQRPCNFKIRVGARPLTKI